MARAATARSATSAPGSALQAVDDAFEGVERLIDQLTLMRAMDGPKAQSAAALLKEGLAILDRADADLAAYAEKVGSGGSKSTPKVLESAAQKDGAIALRRCQSAILRGQLYSWSAAAMEGDPAATAERQKQNDKAIELFRALRVEYRDLPMGIMGYILESRCQRLAGRLDEAKAVLETVLKLPVSPGDKAASELHQTATLEKLEAQLLADPRTAAKEAAQWRSSDQLRNEPDWQGRADWLLARAQLADFDKAPGGRIDEAAIRKCAELLRAPGVVKAAGSYDRLAAMAHLEKLSGQKLMERQELMDLAPLQAALRKPEAAATFVRLLAMGGPPLPGESMLAYVQALWRQGSYLAAADSADTALAAAGKDDARYADFIQLRAAALLKHYQQDASGQVEPLRSRLAQSLRAVFEADVAETARRDALSQWVAVMGPSSTPGEILKVIDSQQALAAGDPYLLYWRASCRCEILWSEAAKDANAPQLPQRARQLVSDVQAVGALAAKTSSADVAARCALLEAQVLASAPLADARAALKILNDRRALLDSDKAIAPNATVLRVQLLTDLGMVEEATKEFATIQEARNLDQAGAPLGLAEALADRYPSADAPSRDRIRRQVTAICNTAMAAAVGKAQTFTSVARRSAAAMLKAGALADAEQVAGKTLKDKTVQADAEATLSLTLIQAEALEKLGRTSDALALLEALAGKFPKSAAVPLARGRCQLALRLPDKAGDSFRQARKLCPPGGADWCLATLELAAALRDGGNAAAARDILRVSQALYPDFGGPSLRARLIGMQEQQGTPNAK